MNELSENRKANRHESWLNRRAYRKHFGPLKSAPPFRNWPGVPDRCSCGCGFAEHSRSNPTNWWQSFNPKLLWEVRFLLPLFRSLYKFLWTLSRPIWVGFRSIFSAEGFNATVVINPLGNRLGTAMTPVRLLTWSIISLVLFSLWIVAWSLPRFGGIVILLLYIASLVLVVGLMLSIWTLAVVFIASHGILFLIGGAASILYLSNPVVGALLIAAGVGLEYESKRRRDRHHREEIGRLLRIIESDSMQDRGASQRVNEGAAQGGQH